MGGGHSTHSATWSYFYVCVFFTGHTFNTILSDLNNIKQLKETKPISIGYKLTLFHNEQESNVVFMSKNGCKKSSHNKQLDKEWLDKGEKENPSFIHRNENAKVSIKT